MWAFKDENVLRAPIGIALDKNRNTIQVEIGSTTLMANIYCVCNDVSNDIYKYDFTFVVNCNSYNVFSGV
jgi:hypothetical protein